MTDICPACGTYLGLADRGGRHIASEAHYPHRDARGAMVCTRPVRAESVVVADDIIDAVHIRALQVQEEHQQKTPAKLRLVPRMRLVHDSSKATGQPLCGDQVPEQKAVRQSAAAEVTCPSCVRLLADEARRTVPHGEESED